MRKIVLITGATSGIGEACARKFAQGGYDVIITGRRAQLLANLKKELEAEGVRVLALALTYEIVMQQLQLSTAYHLNGSRLMS